MKKIISCLVLVVAVTGHKHYLEFSSYTEGYTRQGTTQVSCSVDAARERDDILKNSKCALKEVFEYLKKNAAHEDVSPRGVWVKRCVGLCEYENQGPCVSTGAVVRQVPVRIYNAKKNKESCAMYPVADDVTCGCCVDDCENPPVPVY